MPVILKVIWKGIPVQSSLTPTEWCMNHSKSTTDKEISQNLCMSIEVILTLGQSNKIS